MAGEVSRKTRPHQRIRQGREGKKVAKRAKRRLGNPQDDNDKKLIEIQEACKLVEAQGNQGKREGDSQIEDHELRPIQIQTEAAVWSL